MRPFRHKVARENHWQVSRQSHPLLYCRQRKTQSMTNLGQQWRQHVPTNDHNHQLLREGIQQREERARTWVAQAQLKDLQSGIDSCISRGSDSLALPIPSDIATSQAVRNFMNMLNDKGILADIALDGDEPGISLMLVMPAA